MRLATDVKCTECKKSNFAWVTLLSNRSSSANFADLLTLNMKPVLDSFKGTWRLDSSVFEAFQPRVLSVSYQCLSVQLPSGRVYVMNLQANLNLISELLIYTLREEEKFQKCWPLVVQQKLSGKFQTHKMNFYPIKIWKRLDAIWTLHTSISFSGALSVAAWEAVNKTRFPDGKMLEDVCRLVLWKCLLCVE